MTDLILTSFELTAEIAGDITPAIYQRYFADCPGSEELMSHIDEGVKIKMMNEVMRLIMVEDYKLEGSYLNFEVDYHKSSYSVQHHMYANLLNAVQAEVEETLGTHWDDAMADAWDNRISDLSSEIESRAVG